MKAPFSGAARLYVDSSISVSGNGFAWSTAKKTLTEALTEANSNVCVNEIWVRKGTYYPTTSTGAVTTSRDSAFRVMRNGVKVYGGFAGTETVLSQRNIQTNPTLLSGNIGSAASDTDNSYHVVTVLTGAGKTLDSTTRLDGVSISGGVGAANTTTLHNIQVANDYGGGLLILARGTNASAAPTIINCSFTANASFSGGGAAAVGLDSGTVKPKITSCYFANNGAIGTTSTTIQGVSGGGLVVAAGGIISQANVVVEKCTFDTNTSGVYGGAIGVRHGNNPGLARVEINNSFFTRNWAQTGGALEVLQGRAVINNSVFSKNSTSLYGGAITCGFSDTSVVITGSTFSENTCANPGYGQTLSDPNGGFVIDNSIVWGAATGHFSNFGTFTRTNSNVKGVTGGAGNISTDPLFVNAADADGADNIAGTADDGLKLLVASPSRNAGSNALITPGITTDITSGPRIYNTTVDMGAYETEANLRGPASVDSGIVLWLDGSNVDNDTGTANPANATVLTTWKDVSGNSSDAVVLAGQNAPALNAAQINGKDVVKFTRVNAASGSVYQVPNVDLRAASMPQTTIFTVYRQATPISVSDWEGIWGADNGGWDRFFMPRFGNTSAATNDGIVSVGLPTAYVPVTNAGIAGSTRLLTAVYDHGVNNGSTIYFNAIPVQSVTDSTDLTAAQATLRIGWDGDDNTYNGDIAEMVVYNRKLTDCEIRAVNRYFGYKYGVTLSTAAITPSPSVSFCSGLSTILTATSPTPGSTFTWLRNGTLIPGATATTYTASTTGNYQVIASANGCSDTSAATAVQEIFSVLHVDSAATAWGTGASWASPLKTVDSALRLAHASNCPAQVWVKKGTYYPMAGTAVASSRDSSFRIYRNSIKVYGGFGGTDTTLATRNPALYPTILSGDIGATSDSTDNSYHVFTITSPAGSNVDSNTRLDGLTITGGNGGNGSGTFSVLGTGMIRTDGGGLHILANGAGDTVSATIENCIITRNSSSVGGGVYCSAYSGGVNRAYFRNTTVTQNTAAQVGGLHSRGDGAGTVIATDIERCRVIANKSTGNAGGLGILAGGGAVITVSATSSVISNNTADFTGGGAHSFGSGAFTFTNCVLSGNLAGASGGGGGAIYVPGGATVTFNNSTLSNNVTTSTSAPGTSSIRNFGTTTLNNTVVWGDSATQVAGTITYNASNVKGVNAAGSSNSFPHFLNPADPDGVDDIWATTDDGLRVNILSANVNGGNNALIPTGIATDITGAARTQGSTVDIGAYESAFSCINGVVYVDSSKAVSGDGTSWAQAFKTLTEGLTVGNRCTDVTEIWVAKGTYFPMQDLTTASINQDSSLRIYRNGLKVYGGFAGNETALSQRSITGNPTLLSGDLNVAADSVDNAYHVVTIAARPGTTIDSSTILDGFSVTRGNGFAAAGNFTSSGQTFNRQDGGAVQICGNGANTNCSPKLANCTFVSNSANFGGAIYAQGYNNGRSIPVFTSCTFSANDARNSGGGYFVAGNACGALITGTTFSNNRAVSAAAAWFNGVNGQASVLSIRNSTITSNQQSGAGNVAGLYIVGFPATAAPLIKNTVFSGNNALNGHAGAMRVDGGAITIDSSTFTDNKATTDAGALFLAGNVTATITSSSFTGNRATTNGGAIHSNSGSLIATGSQFSQDTAVSIGGAIYGNRVTLTSCVLTNNRGTVATGAIEKVGTDTAQITDCRFIDNRGGNRAGAVNATNGVTYILRSVFSGNIAQDGSGTSGSGGGMQASNGIAEITNSIFANNAANGTNDDGGGGLMVYGGTVSVNNTTFSNNTTASGTSPNGNAVNRVGGTLTVNNSILWGSPAVQASGTATFQNSDVRGLGLAAPNLDLDPRFINASDPDGLDNLWATSDDGLRLDTCSPAINGGANALVPVGVTQDITASAARIQLAVVDMGAYEHAYGSFGFPDVTALVASPQPLCSGASLTLTATVATAGTPPAPYAQYQWYRGTQAAPVLLATTTTPTLVTTAFTATVPGTDTAWVVLTNTRCSYSDTSVRIPVQIITIPPSPTTLTGATAICNGATQTYTTAAVPGATAYVWTVPSGWTVAAPSTSLTTTTPSLTVTPSGTSGNVTVRAQNSCGTSPSASAASLAVTVTSIPAQPGTVSGPTAPCLGTSPTYSVATVTGATTYAWTLPGAGWTAPGGLTTTTPSLPVTLSATAAASGNITVVATNGCGTSPARTLAVAPNAVPLAPGAISGPVAPCRGTVAAYSVAAVANTTSYQWTLPSASGWTGSPTATTTAPSLSTTPGAGATGGTLSVAAVNVCGTGPAATLSVAVDTVPPAPTTLTLPAAICFGAAATYTASPVAGVAGGSAITYAWTLPSGWSPAPPYPVSTATATLSATAGASGTIEVRAVSACGQGPARSAQAQVQTIPPAPALIAGPSPVCAATSQTYAVAAIATATSYAWTLPSGWVATSTVTGTSVTATTGAGSPTTPDTIRVAALNVCGSSATVSRTISVTPTTATSLTLTPSVAGAVICPGTPITFTATPTGGGAAPTYAWTRGGTTIAGVTGPTWTPPASVPLSNGETIGVVMTSTAPCPVPAQAAAAPVTVTVLPPVVPGVSVNATWSGAPVVCPSTPITFSATTVGGGAAPQLLWYRDGAPTGVTTPTYTVPGGWTPGATQTVEARLTSSAQCASPVEVTSNTVALNIATPQSPQVSIAVTGPVAGVPQLPSPPGTPLTFEATVAPGTAGGSPTYQWSRNGVPVPGAVYATWTTAALVAGDTVRCRLTASADACTPAAPNANTTLSNGIRILEASGVRPTPGATTLSLFPNPNGGTFTVQWTAPAVLAGAAWRLDVLNAIGQMVWSREERGAAQTSVQVVLPEASMADGVYMLRLSSPDHPEAGVQTLRFQLRR